MNKIIPFSSLLLVIGLLNACATPVTQQPPRILSSGTLPNGQLSLGSSDDHKPHGDIKEISTDPSYGYTQNNPINVGVPAPAQQQNLQQYLLRVQLGARQQRLFLSALRGPNNEVVQYRRLGACCEFKTANALENQGLLDVYEVFHAGLKQPVLLYLNLYDAGPVKAPKGFTVRETLKTWY